MPIVAFVDDFFATVPASVAQLLFDMFKWFVVELLGCRFKVDKKEFAPAREGKLLGVWVTLTGGGNGEFY